MKERKQEKLRGKEEREGGREREREREREKGLAYRRKRANIGQVAGRPLGQTITFLGSHLSMK